MSLRLAWRRWTELTGYFGDFQARLMLTIFYLTVLVPFALIVKAFRNPFRGRRGATSAWTQRPAPAHGLDAARRQA